jgi:hypothetical protein
MARSSAWFTLLLPSLALLPPAWSGEAEKITYEDHVLPILRDHCLKCHNPDKLKGDLDLSSYAAAVKGGGSGATLSPGDPDGSLLLRTVLQVEEPSMPPNSRLPEREVAVLRRWIEGGLLQGRNSRALTPSRPSVELAAGLAPGRPEGPPPLPEGLSLEPGVVGVAAPAITALAHSPWAPLVALSGARQVVLYRSDTFAVAGVLPFPEGLICDLKFSRNGRLLLAAGGRGGHSGHVAVWEVVSGRRILTVGDQFDSVLAADLSADQRWLALGGPDRVLKIYRTSDGGLEHRIRRHTDWITAVEFSPDGRLLASGDRTGGVFVREADSGQELFSLAGHRGPISALSWRPDGAGLISASEDGTIKFWQAAEGAAIRSINAHPGGVLFARFAMDGRLVSGGRDNKVILADANGRSQRTLAFGGDLPARGAVTDSGRRIFAGDWRGRVVVWDSDSGALVDELDAHLLPLARRMEAGRRRWEERRAAVASAATLVQKLEKDAALARSPAVKAAVLSPAPKGAPAKTGAEATLTRRLTEARRDLAQAEARLAVAELALGISRPPPDKPAPSSPDPVRSPEQSPSRP